MNGRTRWPNYQCSQQLFPGTNASRRDYRWKLFLFPRPRARCQRRGADSSLWTARTVKRMIPAFSLLTSPAFCSDCALAAGVASRRRRRCHRSFHGRPLKFPTEPLFNGIASRRYSVRYLSLCQRILWKIPTFCPNSRCFAPPTRWHFGLLPLPTLDGSRPQSTKILFHQTSCLRHLATRGCIRIRSHLSVIFPPRNSLQKEEAVFPVDSMNQSSSSLETQSWDACTYHGAWEGREELLIVEQLNSRGYKTDT